MKNIEILHYKNFKCTFCNSWSGRNKASLGAHIRNCKFNPKNKEINILTDSELANEPISTPVQNIVVEPVQLVVSELSEKPKKIKKSK